MRQALEELSQVNHQLLRLRQPAEPLADEIGKEAARRAKSWSATAAELLEEAVRMRRAPGIGFADGPTGRRAIVAGTGTDVWEVIAAWRGCNEDFDQLRANYPWLGPAPLRAALGYYQLYPEEINARLTHEAEWTPDRVRRQLPFATRPSGPR
ncbi:MAG TPA: DUF433 domain-containing protein [Gemmatimonadales bacterium]|nr:DUF433 domain-containing protein [Gemmatimonadales bacterium]